MHEPTPGPGGESYFDGTRWSPMPSDPYATSTPRPAWRLALIGFMAAGLLPLLPGGRVTLGR